MLTKEEYLTHLGYGVDTCPAIYDAFKELIYAYFDPKPYNFEDLKKFMWVWYEPFKDCRKIREINESDDSDSDEKFKWVEFEDGYVVEFIENHFYPPIKAMQYQR